MGNPFIVAEDLALKTHLSGITVSDDKNTNRSVKVWFGYPDVEVRDQTFPYITIDLIDIIPGNDRQTYGYLTDNDYQGTIAPVEGFAYNYQIPVAYDLIYQVTSYSRHPRHDRSIEFQLLNKFPSKYGYLIVPNELGTENSSRSMFLDGFVKRDAVEGETGNRRLLRNVLTVRVISQMTPAQAAAALPQVQLITINANTSYIPSGLQPVNPDVITSSN
jgi:hypothetical protein